MENNLSSMLDVFTDLMQAITKLIKNMNEKIVLESINYLIKCMSYLYDRMGLKPYIMEEYKRDSIVLDEKNRLESIEEVKSEENSPFVREKLLLNPAGYLDELNSGELRFSRTSSSEKCLTPMKLQAANESNANTFENMVAKLMTVPSLGPKDYKKLLESKKIFFFNNQHQNLYFCMYLLIEFII